jgi:ubiquinone/menaquinone biosynthesis C-methylase UbiE
MRRINYNDWADYIWDICELYDLHPASVLELGGGTCNIANILFNKVDLYVASDYSYDMLTLDDNNFINKICCDMTALPFDKRFDYIFSTFDSVNYLIDKDLLHKLFNGVSQVISDNGIFTFDVSLEKNSYKNVKRLNRKGKYNGIKYVQKSRYDPNSKIHINEFKIFLEDKEIIEIHRQKIYSIENFFEIIEDCGLIVVDCFDSFTFEDAGIDSERIQFVVKKEV